MVFLPSIYVFSARVTDRDISILTEIEYTDRDSNILTERVIY